MMTVQEMVLKQVDAHRSDAMVLQQYAPKLALLVNQLADQYEVAVREGMPAWVDLPNVRDCKGWSDRWLRDWCQEHEAEGLARKKANGHWEIRSDAALELPFSSSAAGQSELDALAVQLGGEA